jgi:prepilin-type processing-associated H-X9-DG protein
MYISDYDFPPDKNFCLGKSNFRMADDPQSMPFMLNPYVKNRGIWTCPDAILGRELPEAKRNSYAFSISTTLMENPDAGDTSEINIGWDNFTHSGYSPLGQSVNAPVIPTRERSDRTFPHPNKGINRLYADGHVKTTLEKLSASSSTL